MDDTNTDLQDQDESVRIAVRALGDMRNNAQRADPPSSPDSNSPFVSRMSHIPLVNSALRVYEQGKASSRVVKYGAEMMESSVKTISRPVIDRLPVNVNQLDEFACRQLDRLDRYRRPSTSETDSATSTPTSPISSGPMPTSTSPSESTPLDSQNPGLPKVKLKSGETSAAEEEPSASASDADDLGLGKGWKGKKRGWLQASSPFVGPAPPPPELASSSSSTQPQAEQHQVVQRSRWQAVLLEAGGLSAALSEESLRRLKYCLQWLQYATAHIDAQILILRDFTASLRPLPSQTREPHPPISQAHMRTLITVRRDIVHTVKQVVDVVSKYAGGALPEPARGRVRGFILDLPQRWARKAGTAGPSARDEDGDRERERESVAAASAGGAGPVRRSNRRGRDRGPGAGSAPSSRATSPMARHTRHQDENGDPISAGTAIVAAQRILTLATESLDMMRGVTGVVKDSLDRADAWVGRFRTVGLQRGERTEGTASPPSHDRQMDDPEMELDFTNLRHRRVASFGSQLDEMDAMPSPYSGSSYSSYAGGSSVPSTPGAGTHTPVYAYSSNVGGAASPIHMGLGLSSMTLSGSAYGTPKSVAGGLPEEGDADESRSEQQEEVQDVPQRKEQAVEEVKIAGMDVEGETEDGVRKQDGVSGKMDVDICEKEDILSTDHDKSRFDGLQPTLSRTIATSNNKLTQAEGLKPMRNVRERLEAQFGAALDYNPPSFVFDRSGLCPQLTLPFLFYAKHIDERLSLKRVVSIPSFPALLRNAVSRSLDTVIEDLVDIPSVDEPTFPSPDCFTKATGQIQDAVDIAKRYQRHMARSSGILASMLLLHPTASTWVNSVHLKRMYPMRQQRLYAMNEDFRLLSLLPYEGTETKTDLVLEKVAWEALDNAKQDDLRELSQRFPVLALWQIFFPLQGENIIKSVDSVPFSEQHSRMRCHALWQCAGEVDLPPYPDALHTAWGPPVSTFVRAVAEDVNSPAPPKVPLRRSTRVAQKSVQTESQVGGKSTAKSQPRQPWSPATIPSRITAVVTDELITISTLQHAWARAVEVDSSFIILHCGTFERILFRHRSSQTLFVSELIDVMTCKDPQYGEIQLGLYLSIITDALDRMLQLVSHEAETEPANLRKRKFDTADSSADFSRTSKRRRTRAGVAQVESQRRIYQSNFKRLCDASSDRPLLLLRIQHHCFNSPAPASFLRVDRSEATPQSTYNSSQYFCAVITYTIASGACGDAHKATIELEASDGETLSFSDAVVKLCFGPNERKRMRHEYTVYKHLISSGVKGVPHVFGLFEDVESDAMALLMTDVGTSLVGRAPDQKNPDCPVTPTERDAFIEVLKSIHTAGVRHRDLRVENLVLSEEGLPFIIDFDRAVMGASERSRHLEVDYLCALLDGDPILPALSSFHASRPTAGSDRK
ncbi:hypothetical protein DXG01_008097 [Tephrocybe rancida]|nr:hypothetical protein DXG01_008097 [Tephrocybe rancida]